MITIGTKDLIHGFVNCYGALLLPTDDDNAAQDTHAITDYFRRLGCALGFYPWCEWERHDLDWFDQDGSLIFHLETENQYSRLAETIGKLLRSTAKLRMGIVWTNLNFEQVELELDHLRQNAPKGPEEIILVVRSGAEKEAAESSHVMGKASSIGVRCWLAAGGECICLEDYDWYILYPNGRVQSARWKETSTNC